MYWGQISYTVYQAYAPKLMYPKTRLMESIFPYNMQQYRNILVLFDFSDKNPLCMMSMTGVSFPVRA